jgi:hypothetical protein
MAELRGDAALRFFVLLGGDLAVAEQELAERMFGGARAGEDDFALFPVDRALELSATHDQLAAFADHGHEAQDVGQLDLREIALKDWSFRHWT